MLSAQDIHKTYYNGGKAIHVLRGVGLNIEKGKFVAITGPSGAGKSTLLHILGGLDTPSKGHVVFQGRDINRLSDEEVSRMRNEKIGFVFQFYHLLSEFTVLENVLMPALISQKLKAKSQKLKQEAAWLLEKIGLKDRIAHFPNQLSGGEKQRVAIARALINDPEMLFCDEPTGNLDSKTGNEIIALLKQVNTEKKMAVVLVTHNLELVKLADSVYHLKDGVLG